MPNEGKAGVIVIPGPEEEEEPISRHNSTDADDDGDEYDEFDEAADGLDAEQPEPMRQSMGKTAPGSGGGGGGGGGGGRGEHFFIIRDHVGVSCPVLSFLSLFS